MPTKHLSVLINIRNKVRLVPSNMFIPSSYFLTDRSKAVLLLWILFVTCVSCHISKLYVGIIGLELAIDPPSPPPRGNFLHYDFLKLHYIRHKIKDVSPLRVAALTCNITLYTLPPPPPEIALNVPDNVSTMTCSYIFAC